MKWYNWRGFPVIWHAALSRGAGAALLPLLLAACGPPARRADLVFINGAEPDTLDPSLITTQLDQRVCYALFEGLTSFDSAAHVQPGMAERWEVSPDGLTYTFHLRANAFWSDGRPITAAEFVSSWRHTLLPETAAEYAGLLYYIKNGRAFNEGTLTDFSQVGVRALDDRTFEVRLESPTPFFIGLCCTSTFCPVPLAAIDKWGGAWTKPEHIVTNGAFTLAQWRLNDRIRLEKNPRYWNASHVRLNSIDVLPISRPNTALNFFGSGLADLLMDKTLTPPNLVSELRKRPEFHAAPFLGTLFIRFNCQRSPFNDARVRQAFALVVNKKTITEKITRAGEIPAASFVPPGAGGYQPPGPGLPMDPTRARALLAEAGYPGGAGFPPISYLYNQSDVDEAIGIELQGMVQRELGIYMALRRQETKVYNGSLSSIDYDMARSSWVGDYNDPNTFLDMFVTGGGNNRTGWSNPEYDRMIADAGKEVDQQKRFAIFRRAETMLVAGQTPICPVYYYVGIQIYDPGKIGGIEANILDEHPLKAIYLKGDLGKQIPTARLTP